ncbi:methyltransferase domain-containing protein [Flavobacterium gelatinilyticum]|uniref:methyltransferase domain-containing protein n=1 Tax=Flavobacterium gelatinilyticum TaxID=3003260 RepID=UPI0024808665|nr:methyltransferase domain-containing protein [Flavobacterium gelatinilyticum]
MPWNPDIYNKFKNIRFQPFYDLIDLIEDNGKMQSIDLGCGTGEQTYILSEKFESAQFIGIDSSEEMLAKSQSLKNERLDFKQGTTEDIIASGQKWDLIFSNAALQWSDDHHKLFSSLINLVNENGQFAVQMPVQAENILNKILLDLVQEEPYKSQLKNWKRESPLLSIDEYAQILFDSGLENIQIMQKVYPIIADDAQQLLDFISGSALIPYIERLTIEQQQPFISEYKKRIEKAFPKFPAIYAFKRLLLYGKKK